MSQNGKGSRPRPLSVDDQTFESNWNRIFKQTQESIPPKEYTELLNSGLFWERFPSLTGNWSIDAARWNEIADSYKLGLIKDL